MTKDFGNLITAMITPFNENGDLDYDEAIKLANHLVDTGTDTILLAGTTGESPTLSHNEEFELFRQIKKSLGNRAYVMAGTGSNCTKTAIESTKMAEKIGVDAVLQVVPYYNKPSQEGMYQHFKAVALNTDLPVMLYNIPGRTGVNMLPETIAKLSEIDGIWAIKEAGGNPKQVAEIRELSSPNFEIYSGDDSLVLDFIENGARGVVSVASHIVGKEIKQMMQLYTQGKKEEARKINNKLMPLFKVLFITSNPVPLKASLNMMGFKVGGSRLPLVDTTSDEKQQIESILKKLSLI